MIELDLVVPQGTLSRRPVTLPTGLTGQDLPGGFDRGCTYHLVLGKCQDDVHQMRVTPKQIWALAYATSITPQTIYRWLGGKEVKISTHLRLKEACEKLGVKTSAEKANFTGLATSCLPKTKA